VFVPGKTFLADLIFNIRARSLTERCAQKLATEKRSSPFCRGVSDDVRTFNNFFYLGGQVQQRHVHRDRRLPRRVDRLSVFAHPGVYVIKLFTSVN